MNKVPIFRYTISFIIAIIIIYLIRCNGNNIVRGPDSNEIRKKKYYYKGEYYKFVPYVVICPI